METYEFDLLWPDIFDCLRDVEWFISSISLAYAGIARDFDCVAIMSRDRLIQAHDIFWHDADGGKLKNMPEGTLSLDQFKLSAYLCFWLRRMHPVMEIRPIQTLGERDTWLDSGERLSRPTEQFILYGNEVAALTIAARLVQYLSVVALASRTDVALLFDSIKLINQDTLVEYAKILKHKNISAHGLNMALQMLCGVGQRAYELPELSEE